MFHLLQNIQHLLDTTSSDPKKAVKLELFLKHSEKGMWVTYSKKYKARPFLGGRSLRSSLMTEGQDAYAYRKGGMFKVYPVLRPCIILHPEGSTLLSGIRGTFLYPKFPYYIIHQFILYYVTIFLIIPHQQHCCSTAPTRDTALAPAWSSNLGNVCSLFSQDEWENNHLGIACDAVKGSNTS